MTITKFCLRTSLVCAIIFLPGHFNEQTYAQTAIKSSSTSHSFTVTVTFIAPPTSVSVEKAALRYNKTFAYSFILDDGLNDAYTCAFPLLRGGLVAGNNTVYPGYFYSDGCGNVIPFSAGISWFSVNSAYKDLHINTPSYITWNQLITMFNAGWNVLNHSYSHATYGTTDYDFEVAQNVAYVKANSGIDLTHFVVPSGDQGYVLPAFAHGMRSVSGNNGSYRGSPNGYRIDQPIDFNDFKLYKMLVCDANHDTTNIMQKINNAAAISINGQHYWWSDFTHRVGFQLTGSSLLFPLFQYYMEHVAQQYGIAGADNLWMAPVQDVYEYLNARDHTQVDYSLSGNTLKITVDYSMVPVNMRTNALSLVIQADQNFNNVVASGPQGFTYKGTGANKLINLQWTSENSPENTFTGAISSYWNVAGNWSRAQVPLADADVTVPSGTPHPLKIVSTGNVCHNLLILPGANLGLDPSSGITIFGNLTIQVGGKLENNGTINIKGHLVNENP